MGERAGEGADSGGVGEVAEETFALRTKKRKLPVWIGPTKWRGFRRWRGTFKPKTLSPNAEEALGRFPALSGPTHPMSHTRIVQFSSSCAAHPVHYRVYPIRKSCLQPTLKDLRDGAWKP